MKLIVLAMITLFSLTAFGADFDAEKHFKNVCSTCHTVGGGDKIGPDLAGLSKRRTVEWLVKFINYPDGMVNGDAEEPGYEKPDPIAVKVAALYKPQMMAEQEMTKAQVEAMLKWIDSQKKEPKGKITTLK